jgi:hypothetical protein
MIFFLYSHAPSVAILVDAEIGKSRLVPGPSFRFRDYTGLVQYSPWSRYVAIGEFLSER